MKHQDEAQDKKLIKSMIKKEKGSKAKKVVKHLAEDIKEQASGIKKDLKLAKSMRK